MPYIQEFGVTFGEGLGKKIQYISSIMPSFINGFKMMMLAIQSIISGVQQMLPPIMTFGGTIVTTIQNVVVKATPIIDQIIQAIARILPAVQPIFSHYRYNHWKYSHNCITSTWECFFNDCRCYRSDSAYYFRYLLSNQ